MSYLSQAISYIFHYFTTPAPGVPGSPVLLKLTAKEGYSYFPATPGLSLKDGRYKVSRMLGLGQFSSVFMVRDNGIQDDELVLSSLI
jgi:hypothetical protein